MIMHSDMFCSVILAGADQSAFDLPHFLVKTKQAREHGLNVKLIGILEHGKPHRASFFSMPEEWKQEQIMWLRLYTVS